MVVQLARFNRQLLSRHIRLSGASTRGLASVVPSRVNTAVNIIEVGPRDGLQNIKQSIPTQTKIELIRRLAATGLKNIEATSFVSPKWVPQLADGAEVMSQVLPLAQQHGLRLPVLTPNMRGLDNAIKAGAKEVLVFASATEAFSQRNQNCTVDEALDAQAKVAEGALKHGIAVRGAVSCIFSDPESGPTPPDKVLHVVTRILEMGCYEVALGDTLGVGTPKDTENLLNYLLGKLSPEVLAGHFHDTYGQAVANVVKAYDMGIRTFDSSVAGLGGCPYAKGAKGNVATEDIVYTFEQSGIRTGVDLLRLVETGEWISQQLGIPNGSRAGSAMFAKAQTAAVATPTSPPVQKREEAGSSTAPTSDVAKGSRQWKLEQDTGEYTVSRSGTAVKITLTRSKMGNAMTRSMLEGLTDLYKSLAKDMTTFHIVLSAEGRFFCTGMDLSSGNDRTGGETEDSYYKKVVDLFEAIDKAPQTTIAMINGGCFGGGVGLGFACDVRLVSTKATWKLTEITLGIAPAIISKYLVREWGVSFLREAMLSGREVSAQELARIGAVHGVADDADGLTAKVDAYLDQLARCAPRAAATCKELVRLAWSNPDGQKQDQLIKHTFDKMMAPGSEGKFGIEQFQKKIKKIDWSQFWSSRAKL